MLIDTHCHINIMIKKRFDTLIQETDIPHAQNIVSQAYEAGIVKIVNVGTSVIESQNCIMLAQKCTNSFAVVGLHPNDCSSTWHNDLQKIEQFIKNKKENKIVGIGECGLDYHYPDHNKKRQKDAFKAHVELSLEHNLPLIIHTRDAGTDILECLEPFARENIYGVFHCFSEDQSFADYAINKLGFILGVGGSITYPNNEKLRAIVKNIGLHNIILETDAPYLAPQIVRGKKNHPKYIRIIAEFIANLMQIDFETVAQQTTENACKLFRI